MAVVVSRDGTKIGVRRTGRGAPLVLVHGMSADANRWAPVMSALEEHFTVYAMDRCGRASSEDRATYAIEREIEDVVAVVDSIREPVNLFGHSFGALLALHAPLHSKAVRRLVVYEPYAPAVPKTEPSAITLHYEGMAARDERDAIVELFYRQVIQLNDAELERKRQQPSWQDRIAAAHTVPRELRAAEQFHYDPQRFVGLTVPITMLVGGESPEFLKEATGRFHASLPTSKVVTLAGQKHSAMDTATALFISELRAALE